MDDFLDLLQTSSFADQLRVSEVVYPVVLTLHSIGLAIVVGVIIVIDLRVLGITRDLPLLPMKRLMNIVWGAFLVNLSTGLILFTADAHKFYYSHSFRYKLLSIVLGVTLAAIMTRTVLGNAERYDRDQSAIPATAKILAAISIVLWLSGIGFGRYMAYE
jgi:hypothetical protein